MSAYLPRSIRDSATDVEAQLSERSFARGGPRSAGCAGVVGDGCALARRQKCWQGARAPWIIGLALSGGCSEDAVLHLFPEDGATDCGDVSSGAGASDCSGPSTGGSGGASGGTGGTSAGCGPLETRVRTRELELPARAVPSDEYNPVLLTPTADDRSLLAYKEAESTRVTVVELDEADSVMRTVFQTTGQEAHALHAHDDGGVLVFVREDPDIFSPEFCSQAPCNSLELQRFDDAGNVLMSHTLTDKLNVATEGALFIWWFEHTARIAWAEDRYGVYFRSARTIPLPGGLTPRPGDTLRFVDGSGNRISGGWDFGCIPSWSVRIAYNRVWVAVCHGDATPNAHRVVVIDENEQRELLLLEGVPPAYRALGGLSVQGEDFWLSYAERSGDATELYLARFDSTPQVVTERIVSEARDLDFQDGYMFRSYHASYGDELLLGWQSNNQLMIARASSSTGEVLEGPVAAGATIDRFVEFTPFANGDVGWAHSDASGTVTLTRVLSCAE